LFSLVAIAGKRLKAALSCKVRDSISEQEQANKPAIFARNFLRLRDSSTGAAEDNHDQWHNLC
jgi:hypothetical protein